MLNQDSWGAGHQCKGTLQPPCWLVTKPFYELRQYGIFNFLKFIQQTKIFLYYKEYPLQNNENTCSKTT